METKNINLEALASEIIRVFSPGDIISHEWLRKKLGIVQLRFRDFESERDYDQARARQEFGYMFYIDELRERLLDARKGYMKNIRGEGYMILHAHQQVGYGYNSCLKGIRKNFRRTDPILHKVPPVSAAQQARDNDMRARYAALKQMMLEAKKK